MKHIQKGEVVMELLVQFLEAWGGSSTQPTTGFSIATFA